LTTTGNSISANSATLSISSIDLSSSTIYIPNSVGNGEALISDGNGNAYWQSLPAGVNLSGNETITGNWVNTTNPWEDNEVADDLTISGGSIENTTIGASTPSGGTFTTFRLTTTTSDGHVLTSDANGNASWQAAAGGGGGSNKQYFEFGGDVASNSNMIYYGPQGVAIARDADQTIHFPNSGSVLGVTVMTTNASGSTVANIFVNGSSQDTDTQTVSAGTPTEFNFTGVTFSALDAINIGIDPTNGPGLVSVILEIEFD
jgi:hypothetical protein